MIPPLFRCAILRPNSWVRISAKGPSRSLNVAIIFRAPRGAREAPCRLKKAQDGARRLVATRIYFSSVARLFPGDYIPERFPAEEFNRREGGGWGDKA